MTVWHVIAWAVLVTEVVVIVAAVWFCVVPELRARRRLRGGRW